MQEAINKTQALSVKVAGHQAPTMTAEDISLEIFNGKVSARHISERLSKRPGFPSPIDNVGKNFWRRAEIMQYYRLTEDKKAA